MERAKEIIGKYCNGLRVGVAVSGGADSMCLLRLFCDVLPKKDITVLNVEHGIRGENSVRDSKFVESEAKRLGVKFIGISADVPALSQKSGKSEETEARLVRKNFFSSVLDRGEVDIIATAHHADDNVETVLMHLFRGSGIGGLIGMTEYSDRIVRPLIHATRAEIEAFVRENDVSFVTDETNLDDGYTRNFLRLKVIPLINEKYNLTAATETISKCAAADESFIRSRMDQTLIEVKDGEARIKLEAFSLPSALSRRYVTEAAKSIGKTSDLTFAHIESVEKLARGENGKRAELGGGFNAIREYDCITLYYGDRDEEKAETEDEIPFAVGLTPFGSGYLSVFATDLSPTRGKLIADADQIPDGAVVRTRKAGDRFRPFGSGEKKLKEYFIDRKIPLRNRDKIPLLCYNDRVLAVFGVEISDNIRVTADTINKIELIFTED